MKTQGLSEAELRRLEPLILRAFKLWRTHYVEKESLSFASGIAKDLARADRNRHQNQDYRKILELTRLLVHASLEEESAHGSHAQGQQQFRKRCPGFSDRIYDELYCWFIYVNR